MGRDYIDELVHAIERVVTPDAASLREILFVAGMPEQTQNLRYLGYNRQIITEEFRTLEFSAVAVINNRRIGRWRLTGRKKKLSQLIFSARWTRNPLDLFLNNLRCHSEMMDILASADTDYTLLGILQLDQLHGTDVLTHNYRYIRPVIAIPNIHDDALKTVREFEAANEMRESRITGSLLYRKSGLQMRSH